MKGEVDELAGKRMQHSKGCNGAGAPISFQKIAEMEGGEEERKRRFLGGEKRERCKRIERRER